MSASSDLVAEARETADSYHDEDSAVSRLLDDLADALAASEQRIAELEAARVRAQSLADSDRNITSSMLRAALAIPAPSVQRQEGERE